MKSSDGIQTWDGVLQVNIDNMMYAEEVQKDWRWIQDECLWGVMKEQRSLVAGFCEYVDEPWGSGTMELVGRVLVL